MDSADEDILDPGIIIDDLSGGLALDGGAGDVGVLGVGVVSPDGQLLDVIDGGSLEPPIKGPTMIPLIIK